MYNMKLSSVSICHKTVCSLSGNHNQEFLAMRGISASHPVFLLRLPIFPLLTGIPSIFQAGKPDIRMNCRKNSFASSGLCSWLGCPYLFVGCDTCGTKNLLGLGRARATIAIAATVLTAVHGEVVGRVKFGKTGITTKVMHHVLKFNFKSNLGDKNTRKEQNKTNNNKKNKQLLKKNLIFQQIPNTAGHDSHRRSSDTCCTWLNCHWCRW